MIESTYPQSIVMAEVVLETQLTASTRTKGNMCSAIMASIGLNKPTLSHHRGGE